MKKLLALLLLSPLAFAEPINIGCEYYQSLHWTPYKVVAITGEENLTIKSSLKEVVKDDNNFPYSEKGNQITWISFNGGDVGDKYAMAFVYRLDRVSSVLEVDFMDVKNDKGFETTDRMRLLDPKNYTMRQTDYAKCKKVEALF
ncbi:hypothetical protein N9840_00895 [Gammaproteobacteria bacterium]|nr:hypothetical protein [Gammaproteobacteria bacterium]